VDTDITRVGPTGSVDTEGVLAGLNDLLQLDHDAIGAYEVAMQKLEDRDLAAQIAGFLRDHERHVRGLNEMIAALGGTPKNEPHATAPLKQALQAVGAVGGDRGLLMAWKTNELAVRTKYDGYARKAAQEGWPADVKRLVDENALDEERHHEWARVTLANLGGADGEGGTLQNLRDRAGDVAGTVRDRAADVAGTVRDRAADLASTARDAVGGGVHSVTNRISGLLDDTTHGAGRAVRGQTELAAEYLDDWRTEIETQVRRSPLKVLVAAGLAGFVIGRILR
jgi:rubrerythrin